MDTLGGLTPDEWAQSLKDYQSMLRGVGEQYERMSTTERFTYWLDFGHEMYIYMLDSLLLMGDLVERREYAKHLNATLQLHRQAHDCSLGADPIYELE